MTHFRKKPIVITAITFDQLVAHGIAAGGNVVNGMPWSFIYNGHPITHENDNCYIIPTLEGSMHMGRDDMLITGVKGEIYPCKKDIFAATYEAAPQGESGMVELETVLAALRAYRDRCKGQPLKVAAVNRCTGIVRGLAR